MSTQAIAPKPRLDHGSNPPEQRQAVTGVIEAGNELPRTTPIDAAYRQMRHRPRRRDLNMKLCDEAMAASLAAASANRSAPQQIIAPQASHTATIPARIA